MPNRRGDLYFFALISGFVVLSLEILAFRMLAPHFGNSVFVSGSIVTVILAFLSLGYLIGGRLADRQGKNTLLPAIFISSTAYILAMIFAFRPVLEAFSRLSTVAGSLAGCALLFSFPAVVLSFVSPILVKLHAGSAGVGASAGNIYAVSTLGSILGSLVTTFAFIPFLGVKLSLLANALLLCACGLRVRLAPFLVLLAVCALAAPALGRPEKGFLYFKESPYNTVFVVQVGERKFLRLNQNRGMHSASLFPDHLTGLAVDDYLLGPKMAPVDSLLILGGGAGTSAAQFTHFYRPRRIDMVEIDPEVPKTAATLGLSLEGVRLIHEDARRFLRRNRERYDMVEIDLFAGGIFIPSYVATREFFQDVAAALNDGGIAMMNVVRTGAPFSDAIADSLSSAFPQVYSLNGRMLVAFKAAGGRPLPGMELHAPTGQALSDDRSDLDWRIYRFASTLPRTGDE